MRDNNKLTIPNATKRKYYIPGITDLFSVDPLVSKDWDFNNNLLMPSEIAANSNKIVWWKCKTGMHSWDESVSSRVRNKTGCPICSGHRVQKGFNDLETLDKNLAKEWNYRKNVGLLPSSFTLKSGVKVWWTCNLDHEWESPIARRSTGRRTGCPYCKNRLLLKGFNDLESIFAEISREWHYKENYPLTPGSVIYGSAKKVWWKCLTCDHKWRRSISSRTLRSSGCTKCANKKMSQATRSNPGVNDLKTLYPKIAQEWNASLNEGLEPTNFLPGSDKPIIWTCSKNNDHKWKAIIRSRVAGNGCPACASLQRSSRPEEEISNLLLDLGFHIENNIVGLIPNSRQEIDIYIPSEKFAIEFNGIYWHSQRMGKKKNYHLEKYKRCKQEQIYLYQIWEDDWKFRKLEVVSDLIEKILHNNSRILKEVQNTNIFKQNSYLGLINIDKITAEEAINHFGEDEKFDPLVDNENLIYGIKDDSGNIISFASVEKLAGLDCYRVSCHRTKKFIPDSLIRLLSVMQDNNKIEELVVENDYSLGDYKLYENNLFLVEEEIEPSFSYLNNQKRLSEKRHLAICNKQDHKNCNIVWNAGKRKYKKVL